MGAYTSPNQVWYPDTTDIGQPNVWAATMAGSIDTGIGARLQKQEIAVGFKGSLDGWNIPIGNTLNTIIPVTVTANFGDFNNGFTLSGGTATVQTAGMYLVTACLGAQNTGTVGGVRVGAFKNSTLIATSELPIVSSGWTTSTVTTVINCIANDTIYMEGTLTGSPPAHPSYGASTYLSIALVRPV